jgi:hypothetical protein
MTDPSKLAKYKAGGSKARAVREKMDKLRAERQQAANVPREKPVTSGEASA